MATAVFESDTNVFVIGWNSQVPKLSDIFFNSQPILMAGFQDLSPVDALASNDKEDDDERNSHGKPTTPKEQESLVDSSGGARGGSSSSSSLSQFEGPIDRLQTNIRTRSSSSKTPKAHLDASIHAKRRNSCRANRCRGATKLGSRKCRRCRERRTKGNRTECKSTNKNSAHFLQRKVRGGRRALYLFLGPNGRPGPVSSSWFSRSSTENRGRSRSALSAPRNLGRRKVVDLVKSSYNGFPFFLARDSEDSMR